MIIPHDHHKLGIQISLGIVSLIDHKDYISKKINIVEKGRA